MKDNKLGLWLLVALVVGNMVGSGIFMLPNTLAKVANPAGVITAWALTGAGVLMIALVFGNLSIRKPDLSGGPQLYATALFRKGSRASHMSGYFVSWGYWVANISGNVAIVTTFASYLSTFFPIMMNQAELFTVLGFTLKLGNLITFIICSAFLWVNHAIILRGIEGAGKLNLIATAAKVLGFALFIIIALTAFQSSNIMPLMQEKLNTAGEPVSYLQQISMAAMATMWAFLGVESAVVFSKRARKKSYVQIATILGLGIALLLYMSISILAMGVMTQEQLMNSHKPLVDALSIVIGPSGSYLMAGLGLISLIGTTIGWILLSAEVPYQAAKQGLFLPIFQVENRHGAPAKALTITNFMTQILIFSTVSSSIADAFELVTTIAILAVLVPYTIAALYQLKLVWLGETYEGQKTQRIIDGTIASLATIYSLWVIRSGMTDWFTFVAGVGMVLFGIVFYPLVKKNK
ncbi:amino acid permease [Paenibacillus sp. N1-5-1-14]|uniref:amino acid permease n=1 Tax=Paenibacillus radicibacter TaxID=2972488 RepID=UPI0021596C6E|nr:amino acid permease [Paenibacillus radicibacter]MCR8642065.1 amino acid permease [Paenibacillus radicibacter]